MLVKPSKTFCSSHFCHPKKVRGWVQQFLVLRCSILRGKTQILFQSFPAKLSYLIIYHVRKHVTTKITSSKSKTYGCLWIWRGWSRGPMSTVLWDKGIPSRQTFALKNSNSICKNQTRPTSQWSSMSFMFFSGVQKSIWHESVCQLGSPAGS